jgi:hypothetical protein
MGLLEVKGEFLWDGEGSRARVQAAAAEEWAHAINGAKTQPPWEFAVVLDQDAERANTLEELRGNRLPK